MMTGLSQLGCSGGLVCGEERESKVYVLFGYKGIIKISTEIMVFNETVPSYNLIRNKITYLCNQ